MLYRYQQYVITIILPVILNDTLVDRIELPLATLQIAVITFIRNKFNSRFNQPTSRVEREFFDS